MPLMSMRVYAVHAGVTLKAIQDRIASGAISQAALIHIEGKKFAKIDSEKADKDFASRHSPQHKNAGDLLGEAKKKKSGVLPNTKPPEVPKPKLETREIYGQQVDTVVLPTLPEDKFERYRDAKSTTEELRARKLELEVAEIEGRLLDAEEVKRKIYKEVSQIREALLNIAPKVAPVLVSITNVVVMENKIIDEINLALEGLSRLTDE
jgi:hypothetical protein